MSHEPPPTAEPSTSLTLLGYIVNEGPEEGELLGKTTWLTDKLSSPREDHEEPADESSLKDIEYLKWDTKLTFSKITKVIRQNPHTICQACCLQTGSIKALHAMPRSIGSGCTALAGTDM